MKLVPSNAIDIGRRTEQQDDFGFSDPSDREFLAHGGLLGVVVDGMGGVQYGRDSARTAKTALLRAYEAKSPAESIGDALERALHDANDAVIALGRQMGDAASVGATVTAAVLRLDEASGKAALHWISVGDSALFVLHDGELSRVTLAHEVTDRRGGQLVSSYLGLETLHQIDRSDPPFMLGDGDRVLVCSDGLFRTLDEQAIARTLKETPADDVAEALINAAMAVGNTAQDNITSLVIACEPDGAAARRRDRPVEPGPVPQPGRNGSPRLIPPPPPPRPAPRRFWPVLVGVGLLLALVLGGGFAAWRLWQARTEAAERTRAVARIDADFKRGDCNAVKKQGAALGQIGRADDPPSVAIQIDACDDYLARVARADEALKRAEAETDVEIKRAHLERARSLYEEAARLVPGSAAADRVKECDAQIARLVTSQTVTPPTGTPPASTPPSSGRRRPGAREDGRNQPG